MKVTKIYCDVCNAQRNCYHTGMQVIFTTDQTEGRQIDPYFDTQIIDICEVCLNKTLSGKYIFAYGAQGINKYYFKEE